MTQLESEELEQLMPNIQAQAQKQSSPGNTAALRQYIKMLGEKPANISFASTVPHKPRTDGLQPRAGTGRRPHRRFLTIKWRVEEAKAQQAEDLAELDLEALKDALLEHAKVQRRALMEVAMRPGTGRVPQRREFAIALPPMQLQLEEEEQAEVQPSEEGADELEMDWEMAVGDGTAGEQQMLEYGEYADQEAWVVEEGVLAEQQALAALQPAAADLPASTAVTPGAALLHQASDQLQSGDLQQEQAAETQLGQAKTPATSPFGRYTPMEGVPERLVLLATCRKQPPATVSRSVRPAGTPAGFTPLEGIPERLLAYQNGPRPLGLPGATRVCSNEAQQSVDSPVEGLVQQGARGSKDQLQPCDGDEGFAGFAQRSPQQEQQQHHKETLAADNDDNADFGFADDYGAYEEEAASPSQHVADAGKAGGFPSLAGDPSAHLADACAQTGASLGAGEAAVAAAAGGSRAEPAAEADDDDAYGGYDAGGGYDAQDVYGLEPELGLDADLSDSLGAAQPQRRQRKATKDPGSRLRNELKRKSLAVDPKIGRHEVMPGVRRSCRAKQEPLRWWLNEKKEFGRQHQTMPTVRNVVHKVPNTPWQMVTDIKRRPAKKQLQHAPTPNDLDDALAGVGEEEEQQQQEETGEQQQQQQQQQQEVEEQEQIEEVAAEEEQQAAEVEEEQEEEEVVEEAAEAALDELQQQQRGWRRAPSARRQQPPAERARTRQVKAAAAKAPAAKGKGTKKKAAGSKRRGR